MPRVSYRTSLTLLLAAALRLLVSPVLAGSPSQAPAENRNAKTFDPLTALTESFPKTVTLKTANTVLEFCPDNTCDGFVASAGTSIGTLKDFAYLYEYFFSDYIYLPDWRNRPESKAMASRVLSKAEYGNCKNVSPVESSRCVLLGVSRKGSVRLIFVRYDERARNVVRIDVVKELEKR